MKSKSFNHFSLRFTAASFGLICITHAANIWDGGGADANWNTLANWDNDIVPTSPAALTFDGSAQLANNNNLTGFTANGITFNAGAGAFLVGGNTLTLGGNITSNSASLQTINAGLTLSAARTVNAASGDIVLGGPVTGAFALTKTGAGKLTFSGTGGVAQLLVGNGAAGGSVEFTGGAWTQSGTITGLGLAVGNAAVSSGALTVSGGTITFGGDSFNSAVRIGTANGAGQTSVGSIVVSGGTLKVGTTGALDASVNLATSVNSGTSTGSLTISGGTMEVGRRVLMGANGTTNTATLTLSGSATLNMVRTGSNAEGDLGMVRLGSGATTINFDGGTYIATGLHTSVATNTSTVNFNGTELRANFSGGSFGNGGTANLRVQAGGLFMNTNGFDTIIGSPLLNSLTTTGALTKTGAGTLSLTAANTFTGAVNVNGGTLALTTGTLPATTVASVAAGAALRLDNSVTRTLGAVTLANGASWLGLTGVPVASPRATVTNALTFSGATATIGVAGLSTAPAISGVYDVIQAGSIAGSPALTADFGISRVTGTAAIVGNKVQVTVATLGASLLWNNAAANGAWNLNTSANFLNVATNDVFKNFDSVTFDDSVGTGPKTITLTGTLYPAAITVNNSNGDYTFTGGTLAGGGALVKSGSSRLNLSVPTQSSAVTANGGTLSLGAGATVGANAPITVASGATLSFDRSDTFGNHATAVTQVITANGGTITNGATFFDTLGTVNLNGATLASTGGANANFPSFSLRGQVNVGGSSASTISGSGTNSAMLVGQNTVGTQTTFNVADVTGDAAPDLIVSTVLQNNRDGGLAAIATGILKTGAGTMTLLTANTYTGDTTLTGGTLSLATASLADTADVRISNGSTLNLAHGATDTIDELYINGVQQAAGTWGSLASSAAHKTARITGSGLLLVTTGPAALTYATWASSRGLTAGVNDGVAADPDQDGKSNLIEFALDGQPMSGVAESNVVTKMGVVGVENVLTLTLPVRNGVTFGGSTELVSATAVDGVIYHVQGSLDLADWTGLVAVVEATGSDATLIQLGMPDAGPGWTNRTFYIPGSDPAMGTNRVFIRAKVESAP